jgi:hypothetical protein
MKTTQIIIFHTVFVTFVFQYHTAFAAEEKAIKAGAQAALGKSIESLKIAGPYIDTALEAYNIGKEIKRYTFPTEKEKRHAENVARNFALLTAENELRKCFVDNRGKSERNSFGLPVACEDIAKMFELLDENNEIDRITTTYNQACNLLAKGQ